MVKQEFYNLPNRIAIIKTLDGRVRNMRRGIQS
jgi:hypothetical protein